ncbi:MAG: PTS-dependent dihydroxyacetone kinase phosphotransferase subunit DhaM [Chloroflexi bacterium]|nr:MAG: PTS-dependent dihydroxyacetone kinase phosphotransferase subunit DhaM [Chloroflexota bacterium]
MSVGLVLVSHSARLAEGVRELIEQVTQGQVPVAVAAGGAGGALGTNAAEIADSVTAVGGGDGVVVLVDLGSAVLSAETALELLEPAVRDRARLADAPFVEGAVAAAVEASLGSDLAAVLAAAEAARGLEKLA